MPTKKKTTTRPRKQQSSGALDVRALVGRLDENLSQGMIRLSDSISELAVSVATHKERLDNVDQRANSHSRDIHKLEDSQGTITERINTVQHDLSEKMQAQTESLKQHVNESVVKIVQLVEASDKKREDGDQAILARVAKLEIWRWGIAGGGVVALAILSGIVWKIVNAVIDKVDWVKFFGF